jgi:hypothetical protein
MSAAPESDLGCVLSTTQMALIAQRAAQNVHHLELEQEPLRARRRKECYGTDCAPPASDCNDNSFIGRTVPLRPQRQDPLKCALGCARFAARTSQKFVVAEPSLTSPPQFAPFAILDYPQSSASMLRIVGRCRAISCQFSPSSRLAKTEPLLVPK